AVAAAGCSCGADRQADLHCLRTQPPCQAGVRHQPDASRDDDQRGAAMLTLLEEVVLLTVDPATGRLRGDRQFSVPYALAGAVLFDLALANRIDTDVDAISVV